MVRRVHLPFSSAASGMLLLVAGIASAACSGPEAPTPSLALETQAKMRDELQVTQGTTADHDGSRLSLTGSDGERMAMLNVWNPKDSAWLTHWRLRPGQIFPAGAGFLRVQQLQYRDARATVVLMAASDAGGLTAPAPGQPVLPMGGTLDVGISRIELLELLDDGTARLRRRPKLYPLSRTAAEDIQELVLAAGHSIEIGSKTLTIERIQPDAGDIPAFVVFSLSP